MKRHPLSRRMVLLLVAGVILLAAGGEGVAQTGQRLTLEVQVWQLTYSGTERPHLTWEPFEAASEPAKPMRDQVKAAAARQPAAAPGDLPRTDDGFLIYSYVMKRQGEEGLSAEDVRKRVDLFTQVLNEGLRVNRGEEQGSGRRYYLSPNREVVFLVDTDMNIVKAQLLYDSLFPPPVIARRVEPAPVRQDLSMIIDTLRTERRSPGELESVLNRVTGRTRGTDEQHIDDHGRDRLPMRVTSDAPSGSLILAAPPEPRGYSRPAEAPRQESEIIPSRFQSATVSLERPSIPSRERFRRFGPMNFAQLREELRKVGNLRIVAERPFSLSEGRPVALATGRPIPFLLYRPPSHRPDARTQSAKIGPTINYIPVRLGQDAWQVTLLTELVDFIAYPQLEKIYLEFTTALETGDTLVCKRLVDDEISSESRRDLATAQAADTIVLMTLKPGR